SDLLLPVVLPPLPPLSFPTRRSSDLACRYELAQVLDRTDRFDEAMRLLAEAKQIVRALTDTDLLTTGYDRGAENARRFTNSQPRSEEHTSELQSLRHLVCRLLLEKKK